MDVQSITTEKLVVMKQAAAYLGKCAMWTMPPDVFQHIRRLKDEGQNYVYPPCWEGDMVPPLLGLPVDVSHTYKGINIVATLGTARPSHADIVETFRQAAIETAAQMRRDDPVEHPKHYTSHPSGVECIQIAEHMTFCLGNAVKYIWRADLKHDDSLEDLRKAKWYIEREIAKRSKRG